MANPWDNPEPDLAQVWQNSGGDFGQVINAYVTWAKGQYGFSPVEGIDLSGVSIAPIVDLLNRLPGDKVGKVLEQLVSQLVDQSGVQSDAVLDPAMPNDQKTAQMLKAVRNLADIPGQDEVVSDFAKQTADDQAGTAAPAAAVAEPLGGPQSAQPTGFEPSGPYQGDSGSTQDAAADAGVKEQQAQYRGTDLSGSNPQFDPALPGQAVNLRDLAGIGDQDAADYQRLLGHDPKKAYSDYVDLMTSGDTPGRPHQDYATWLRGQVQTAMGPIYTAVRNVQQEYALLTGTAMPADLETSILDYFTKNPTAAQMAQSLAVDRGYQAAASGTGTSATTLNTGAQRGAALGQILDAGKTLLNALPQLNNLVTDYINAHPTVDQQKNTWIKQLQTTFMNDIGRMPRQDEIDALWKTPDQYTIQNYLNDQTVQGTNLNFGKYQSAEYLAQKYWNKYFNKSPDQADIVHVASLGSESAVANWVYSQPSDLKGHDGKPMNVGTYETLNKTADKLSQKLWNQSSNADLLNTITQAMAPGGRLQQ